MQHHRNVSILLCVISSLNSADHNGISEQPFSIANAILATELPPATFTAHIPALARCCRKTGYLICDPLARQIITSEHAGCDNCVEDLFPAPPQITLYLLTLWFSSSCFLHQQHDFFLKNLLMPTSPHH